MQLLLLMVHAFRYLPLQQPLTPLPKRAPHLAPASVFPDARGAEAAAAGGEPTDYAGFS
ncbi:hypothetical protein ACFWHQ_20000 [Streptomyces sp. NPDC060334]|uniref:hypothetical protein n=1 Tax=Streptomyces sp. NPDC060334 TaxID=3347099 RepID=UPI00366356B5